MWMLEILKFIKAVRRIRNNDILPNYDHWKIEFFIVSRYMGWDLFQFRQKYEVVLLNRIEFLSFLWPLYLSVRTSNIQSMYKQSFLKLLAREQLTQNNFFSSNLDSHPRRQCSNRFFKWTSLIIVHKICWTIVLPIIF